MKTIVLGHKGYSEKYPENTLLAFEQAIIHGADGVELDVHLSQDGQLVIYHDFTLEALTGETLPIGACTGEYLQSLEIKKDNFVDTIPTLEETLYLFKKLEEEEGRKLWINIELKAGSDIYPNIESKVIQATESIFGLEQVIFSSFDHYALTRIKSLCPQAKTGALTASVLYDADSYLKRLETDFYHPHYLTLTPSQLTYFAEKSTQLVTYTVNNPEVGKQLIQAGVFCLITDRVPEFVKIKP